MSLQVNTIPQDLPPPETRKLIVESLQALRRATNAVFEKVEAQIGDERGMIVCKFHMRQVKVACTFRNTT